MNRKNFIRSLLRYLILAGIASFVGIFVKRGKISSYSDCTANFACKGCGKLSKCTLPEAKIFKKNG